MGAINAHHGLLLSASAAVTMKTSLVSWWDLEEASGNNRADSHGSNTLVESGGTIGNAAGKVGNCAAPTTPRFFSKTSPSGIAMTTGDFTLAAWINTSQTNQGVICLWDTALNHRVWSLLIEGGIAKCGVSTDGSTIAAVATTGSSLNNSAWHLLVGWRSTTDGKVYIQVDNGTPASATFSAGSSLHSTIPQLCVAALNSTNYANGCSIDSCGIWARELTSTERSTLWNSGNGVNYAAL